MHNSSIVKIWTINVAHRKKVDSYRLVIIHVVTITMRPIITHVSLSGARLEQSAARDTKFGLLADVSTYDQNLFVSPVVSLTEHY